MTELFRIQPSRGSYNTILFKPLFHSLPPSVSISVWPKFRINNLLIISIHWRHCRFSLVHSTKRIAATLTTCNRLEYTSQTYSHASNFHCRWWRGGGGLSSHNACISPKPKTLCRWRDINSNRVAVNDKKKSILSRNTLLFAHWLVSLTHNTSFVVRYSFSLAARVNRMNGPRVWQRSSICYFFVARRRIYYGLVGSFTWQCANNLLYIHHWGAESAC